MSEFLLGRYPYIIVIALMMTGLYIVFARENLIKKVVGLNIFQTSVFILYITIGKVAGGTAPIFPLKSAKDHGDGHGEKVGEAHDAADGHGADHAHGVDEAVHGGHDAGDGPGAEMAEILYSNPLPHVLILTAIVVGVATTAVGLALAVRIQEAYGTLEDSRLQKADTAEAVNGSEATTA